MNTKENVPIISDHEVLTLMLTGGIKLCDYALEQWESDKYRLPSMSNSAWWEYQKKNKRRYQLAKSRMRDLAAEFKRLASESKPDFWKAAS